MAQPSTSSSNFPTESYNPLFLPSLMPKIAYPIIGAVPGPDDGLVHYSLAQPVEAADLGSDDDDNNLYFTDSSISIENEGSDKTFDPEKIKKQVSVERSEEERMDITLKQASGRINSKHEDQMDEEYYREGSKIDGHGGSEAKVIDNSSNGDQTSLELIEKGIEGKSVVRGKRLTQEQNSGGGSKKNT